MLENSKNINRLLLVLILLVVTGSFIYNHFNQKNATKIGVGIGDMAPEIELPDTAGNVIRLSQLRGNYVLIDFWAAWCKPCRRENPNLMRTFEQFSTKKLKGGSTFQILSVSADENEQLWKKAIEQDRLKGLYHVSDLKGWDSPVYQKYQVKSIPNNVLIDPEGKVLAIHLRGQQLAEELEKYIE
ncbi:MAG: TlpA family protein disulfide reductase [Flavobacteriales bacterium]|nr:TlpA family protein disulfide reductase [Flavobacteriales bacterium]